MIDERFIGEWMNRDGKIFLGFHCEGEWLEHKMLSINEVVFMYAIAYDRQLCRFVKVHMEEFSVDPKDPDKLATRATMSESLPEWILPTPEDAVRHALRSDSNYVKILQSRAQNAADCLGIREVAEKSGDAP